MFQKFILLNNLRVILTPMASTKTVTVLVLVGTGSKYETREINGASHFLEHLFFKGTKKRPSQTQISKELDGLGAVYNAFTGKEETGFFVKVDSRHFDKALDVLSDMILRPLFPQREIEKERGAIFEEINMIQDTPMRFIYDLWEKLLYGDQPAGWMISGTKESMAKIGRKEILDYFQKQYVAKNTVISIAGNNLNKNEVLAKIKRYFGGIANKEFQKKEKICETQEQPKILCHFKETDQTHLCLGVRTFGIFDKRTYVLEVLANLLGGTMSSRLFSALREKRGLCYYVHADSEHYTDSGYLYTVAGVTNGKVEEAIKITLNEYRKITEKKISESEIKKAKDNIKGRMYLSLETSDAWASYVGGKEILGEKLLTPEEECANIDKVSAKDILNVSREIFRGDKLNLAIIGPFKNKEKFDKILTL